MDTKEKETSGEFTLEDIMREFSSHPEEISDPPQPEDLGPELIPIAPEDRVPLEESAEEAAPSEPQTSEPEPAAEVPAEAEPAPEEPEDVQVYTPKQPEPQATIRLDTEAVKKAVHSAEALAGETVRIDTDAVSAMTGETVRLDPAAIEKAARCADAMSGETIRIDTDAVSAMTGETVRLDADAVSALAASEKAEALSGATVAFTPISEQQAQESAAPQGAEPFSENWEPHYEQPMGEYIPPEPIVFRPRSRLQELKKKLVSGPERRYYALAEQGVGKLQVAMFISLLTVILSAVSIGLHQMAMVQPDRMRLLVYGELFAMLFSAILASDLIFNGFVSMVRLKFNLNSLLAMTFLVCMADGFFCLRGVRVPFCAAFCLESTAALWSEYQRRSTEMGQMDTLRKATRLNRIAKAPDCYDGMSGFYTADGEVEDFMDTYNVPSAPEKALNLYALVSFLASAGIGAAAALSKNDWVYGLQIWSAAILAAAPATIFLCQSRPAAILERRLHRFGVVLCGWHGIKTACGKVVVPLSDEELFPSGSVKVNGVKFYSKREPDQIISYTTALMELSGTVLAPLFAQLLDSRYGQHHEVEDFQVYENGGFGGIVCGETVLVGSLSFVQEMGVHIPDGARAEQAVYTVIGGELCGQFAMAFGKLKGVSAGLATLCAHRMLSPMIVSCNFLLTESFIHEKFGVNPKKILFPTFQQRLEFSTRSPDPEASVACGLSTQESLAATGFAISGSRALATSMRLGALLHIFGGVVGMLIVLALQFVDGGELLSPANLLLFELIWAIPGILLTEWTRGL